MNRFLIPLVCIFICAVPFTAGAEASGTELEDILEEKEPHKLIDSLTRVLPELSPEDLRRGLLRLAEAEEMLGLLDEARQHYLQAAFAGKEDRDIAGMLNSAAILLELGGLDEAETICKAVLNTADDPVFLEEASVQLSRLRYLNGQPDKAWTVLENRVFPLSEEKSASTLYWVYRLAGLTNRPDRQSEALETLASRYPESPEYALLTGGAEGFPSPLCFFGLMDDHKEKSKDEATEAVSGTEQDRESLTESEVGEQVVMIQTGSFLDRENAEYHVRDLADAGFSVEIIRNEMSGKLYHRVVIPDVPLEEVQNYLIRLKDKGYEGWPLYD